MNKQLQISISVAVLLIAGSVAYYIFSYLPTKDLEVNNVKCQELGNKEVSKLNSDGIYIVSVDKTHYNIKLKTCLVEYTANGFKPQSLILLEENHWIVDLYANQALTRYTLFPQKPDINSLSLNEKDKANFEKQEPILMSQ
jgi:hypothetical protein